MLVCAREASSNVKSDKRSERLRKIYRKAESTTQELAEACFRQLDEFVLSRDLNKAFVLLYLRGFDEHRLPFKKMTKLRHKVLRSSSYHMILMAQKLTNAIKTTL